MDDQLPTDPPPPPPGATEPPPPPPPPAALPVPPPPAAAPSNDGRHWLRATISGAFWFILLLGTVFALLGPPSTSYALGVAVGSLLFPVALGVGASGLMARSSKRTWGWSRHLATTLVIAIGVSVVSSAGRLAG